MKKITKNEMHQCGFEHTTPYECEYTNVVQNAFCQFSNFEALGKSVDACSNVTI